MSQLVINVENLSKTYQLGQINTGTFSHDLEVWWARVRGKPNPLLKIGEKDHGNRTGETLWALKDVSFTVEQGEVLGIIGRNGAGKSTLLKILSRVTAPTSGKVKVKGRIASLLEVGTGFHPELTGRENIFLNGAILGMTRQEIARKFDEIVAFAEIEKFIDTPVKRYSSGMYVRLAFAVAAHLESEILLVDEVLAVGDAEFQKKCLGKMGDVASKEGRTVLFVSHNMGAIENLCPNTILLESGKVSDCLSTQEAIGIYLEKKSYSGNNAIKYRDYPSNSRAYLTNVDLAVFQEFKSETPITGQPLEINLSYISNVNDCFLDFAIGIYDLYGLKLLHLSTKYAKKNFVKLPKTGKVTCRIPKFALPEGNYTMNVALYYENNLEDHIENVLDFQVFSGDFFGTGKLPSSKESKLLIDNSWFFSK